MKRTRILMAVVFGVLFCRNAVAGVIASRGDLDTLLGSSKVLEDFDGLIGGAILADHPAIVLDSDALWPVDGGGTIGPGLVADGISFESRNFADVLTTLQRDGGGLLATQKLIIRFSPPVTAFGLDAKDFDGFGAAAEINVYSGNGSLIYDPEPFDIDDSKVFFGFDAGISLVSRVEMQFLGTGHIWSPIVDDVAFAVVPEPSAGVLAIVALVILLRCYAMPRAFPSVFRSTTGIPHVGSFAG